MKKIDLGQTITILANVGVILGIAFLALELQQNNQLLESQVLFNHTQMRLNVGSLHQLPRMGEIMGKVLEGQQLTRTEQILLSDMYGNIFTAWEYEFREYQRGALAEIPIDGYREIMNPSPTGPERLPGLKDDWESRKVLHSREFVDWMDEVILGVE